MSDLDAFGVAQRQGAGLARPHIPNPRGSIRRPGNEVCAARTEFRAPNRALMPQGRQQQLEIRGRMQPNPAISTNRQDATSVGMIARRINFAGLPLLNQRLLIADIEDP